MVKLGCAADGTMNEAKFSEPLPWIGVYIATASLACAVAMASDVIRACRYRKFWFPIKYACINATSLTILAVAVKLSVDLNTGMPSRIDQLTKLSSGVLICALMGNSMPSLGNMENGEMMMNIVALGILVITVIVNICMQLGTGVIYLYWMEHALTMFFMLVLLLILTFSALTLTTIKKRFEFKYRKKYDMAMKECSNDTGCAMEEKLRLDLMKCWMMANTGSPQFVIGRSVTCTAAGALCLLSFLTLAEAMLRSYLMPWSFNFCSGESDYKWSTILVLVTQTAAIGIGTIAPACRWFTAINFRCPTIGKQNCRREFTVENYWTEFLVEMKECSWSLRIRSRKCRKLAHDAKNTFADLCIGIQGGIVLASKAIRYISVYLMSRIFLLCSCCKKLMLIRPNVVDPGVDSRSSTKPDLSRFVLFLEGETELVEVMMKNDRDATDHWINKGKKNQPKHLIRLLEKSSATLQGVGAFDSELVPSLDSKEPSNCWALPVVTLTAIALAIPNIDSCSHKQLIHGVHESLIYIRQIEDNLNAEIDESNIKKTAYALWLGVDLHRKWLDIDLNKLSSQAESTKETLEQLADAAKNRYIFEKKCMNKLRKETPSRWPVKVLAANSMYRISRTLLQHFEKGNSQTSERLYETVTTMIADILGACLTNIHRVISLKCFTSSVEVRELSVRHAVFLLGETQDILKFLNQKAVPCFDHEQMACIEAWRALYKLKLESDEIISSSSDLHLTIE